MHNPINIIPPDQRPRVILRFSEQRELLVSGLLEGGGDIAQRPVVVDVPVERGHVVLLANNPLWRGSTRAWFMAWLARSHPELVSVYRELYGRGAYLPSDYRKMLHARVAPLIAKHGLAPDRRPFRAVAAPVVACVEDLQPTLF